MAEWGDLLQPREIMHYHPRRHINWGGLLQLREIMDTMAYHTENNINTDSVDNYPTNARCCNNVG